MGRSQKLFYALGGFCVGVVLTAAIAFGVSWRTGVRNTAKMEDDRAYATDGLDRNDRNDRKEGDDLDASEGKQDGIAPDLEGSRDGTAPAGIAADGTSGSLEEGQASAWDRAAVYTGGDLVSYQGCRYRAKWWTQGEEPGSSDVWEDLGIADGEAAVPEGVASVPIEAEEPWDIRLQDFKVVGYYPSWKPDKLGMVDFGVVSHVCYAFAIPKADGSLRDLDIPETARALLRSAHDSGAKVLLSVGGWSYNDTLNAVDFINVMAYDGGDGERHSTYQFAVDCGTYWKETRGLPAHKVVLGVPFYARPGWADYGTILERVPDAGSRDHTAYDGMEVYYNGMDTIARKTRYARENLGGIMIWELTQDTWDREKSLLQVIGEN